MKTASEIGCGCLSLISLVVMFAWLAGYVFPDTASQVREGIEAFHATMVAPPPTPTATPLAPNAAFEIFRYPRARYQYATRVTNLRSGPITAYTVVDSVTAWTKLTVLGISMGPDGREWELIRYEGREVFIAGWLTTDALPTATLTPPPTATQTQTPNRCRPFQDCTQIRTCATAYFRLHDCRNTSLDGDNDGVPCENKCPGG